MTSSRTAVLLLEEQQAARGIHARAQPRHLQMLGLLPVEVQARADVLRWLFFLATHVQPWLSLLGQERLRQRSTWPD